MKNRTIHKLPQSIITRIAAGQVVERPVSVVKELIENSIDAGAKQIDIDLSNGGISKIVVTDDGIGMSPKDISLSFLPHTTSKINTINDLSHISSLGFRGEALASIVSMATVIIQSRTKEEAFGYKYTISQSQIIRKTKIGMQTGTKIEVSHLFSSHPARKKQLKSNRIELSLIIDSIERAAVCYHTIGFRLTNNGKIIINVEPETLKSRISSVFSETISDKLIPFTIDKPHMSIKGYVGLPQLASGTRTKSYCFINNRPVTVTNLTVSIKKVYGTLLESRQFPFFIIFISIPESLVDVNIHPQKIFVKTLQDSRIEKLICTHITKLLEKTNLTKSISISNIAKFNKHVSDVLTTHSEAWDVHSITKDEISVMQFNDVYLIAKTKHELLLVDQHAAHERILFNQYRNEFSKLSKHARSEKLKEPKILHYSALNYQIIMEKLNYLHKLGFKVEDFGTNSIVLREVPELFSNHDYEFLLTELCSGQVDETFFRTLATIACKAAIKEGDKLTEDEAIKLITALLKEKEYTTCPHGRPTVIVINRKQFDSMFKRT